MGLAELAVVFALGIPLMAVIGVIFLIALKIMKSDSSRGEGKMRTDEAKMIQDIYHGLQRMEQRVESLETILLDRERKGASK